MASAELGLVGDLGATDLRVGVAGPNNFLEYSSVPTPADPDELFATMGGLVWAYATRFSEDLPSELVFGVGAPGPAEETPEGTQIGPMSNIPGLDKNPVRLGDRLVAADSRLRGVAVITLNDATAATYEAPQMEGLRYPQNSKIITYITHSSGIGGGNILNGEILEGLMEPGKMPIPQYSGNKPYRTLEDLVSGLAIKERYGEGRRSAKEIGKDPAAGAIWSEVGQILGQGIALSVPIIGMGDVVIGGGVSKDHDRYEQALRAEIDLALDAGAGGVVEVPQVTFVPRDTVSIMGLLGAYHAIQLHRGEREYT